MVFEDVSRVQAIKFYTALQIPGRPTCNAFVCAGCHAVAVGWHRFIVNLTVTAQKHSAVLFVVQLPSDKEFAQQIYPRHPRLYRECVEP